MQALCSDLDTPRAIQVIRAIEKDSGMSVSEKVGRFLYADQVLGLDLTRKEVTRELSDEMQSLLDKRADARAEKNWSESDRLRTLLEDQGLIIKDSPNGQDWQWR